MKKYTSMSFLIVFFLLISSTYINAEYGQQNYNRVLSGLGIAASYVGINSQPAFDRNTNGSLEMWVNPANTGGVYRTIISKGATLNVSFSLSIGLDARLIFRISTYDYMNSDGYQIPTNTWTHVAVTWVNGPNFTVKFYVNGYKSGSDITYNIPWSYNTDQIRIGSSQAFPSNIFQGSVDEVRIWATDLSQTKILANRFIGLGDASGSNSGSAITASTYYSSLISSWTFNNASATAYDYISGYNGTFYGSATTTQQATGNPIPYNFALKLGGSNTDNVRIPHSSAFNQTTDGTIELWFKPITFTTEQVLIAKGNVPSSLSFILGVAASTGKLYFGHGTSVALNSTGAGLTLNQWNHIAVTWLQLGATYEIRFYKNGKLNGSPSTITATFPTNTDPVWIGNSAPYVLPAKGWIDALRFWAPALSESAIQFTMLTSSRAFSSSNMFAAINFDGNLIDFSSYGLNASFNNGAPNYCRFSGFTNDTTAGGPNVGYISHSTVINRTGVPNPYPYGYNSKVTALTIPDNNPNGVSDSILINTNPVTVVNVELLLSIEHTYISDLTVSIKAPNGQVRNLIENTGTYGDNVLSFFNDDFPNSLNSTGYYPPWSYVKPLQSFGTFSGTPVNGYWTLKCVDGFGGDVGILRGWGIRFNNSTSNENNSTEIPKEFVLYQNYPNPFNPVTNIKFDLPYESKVNLIVYDILGKEITRIIDNENKKAGRYNVEFNAANLASGIYIYKLETDVFSGINKMILVK